MTLLNRTTKLRMRRVFRHRQKQVEEATELAGKNFDYNFIARLSRLLDVQRFVFGWVFLTISVLVLTILQTVGLSQYYQKTGPVPGGVYNEGMVGTYSNANPLYATGPVDTAVSRLLFSGLFKYDTANQLVGDLADGYEVDSSGKQYTVKLKPGLSWHDGKELTADDVVKTYELIQNPDVQSPLFSSWQGIKVSKVNGSTVLFSLPSALTAFPHSLTNGIIPKHITSNITPIQLRSSSFNTTQPVGSGPFLWEAIQLGSSIDSESASALISLKSFSKYHAGEPKMDGFILHTYETDDQLLDAYRNRSVQAAAGLKKIPSDLLDDQETNLLSFTTTAASMIFLKNSSGVLADPAVRRALVMATNQASIIKAVGTNPKPVNQALLIGQLGYNKNYKQAKYDVALANKTLDDAGWLRGKNNMRVKNGQPLQIRLFAEDNSDNRSSTKILVPMWQELGIDTQVRLQQESDFQPTLETHEYDALLYGISIGPDPDVFVYWHSSQSDARSNFRLNFSEYKSNAADAALESGRTRQDPVVRSIKYEAFLKAWQQDAPAIGLYQPNALYLTRGSVNGLQEHTINTDADRYFSIADWMISSGKIAK